MESVPGVGPDLEIKKRKEIMERALTITKDLICEIEIGQTYCIKSQFGIYHYWVDLDAYTCECLSFPLINFCKHLCAVQHHFPAGQAKDVFTCNNTDLSFKKQEADPVSDSSDDDTVDFEREATKISALVDKLQHLSVCTWLQHPTHLSLALQNLDDAINEAFTDLGHAQSKRRLC